MADSGIITPAPSRRPGSSRIKNNDDDTPKTIKEVNGFTILEKVGQGGMGAVYKARQKSLDRVVALKILPPRIAKSKTFIERFQREARASAKLCHPNLVQGIDIGQDPASKLWYFAMEFVDGPSLKKLMKQEQRIDERRALEIVREVARALDAINSVGMIHRDIKPDNILLTSRGEVKVADFGLTREVDDDSEMTQSGHAIGTPHYMPPEQVRGENDLDIRADLYALGATFYHLVTGKTPFAGNSSAEIMSKHLTEAAPLACALSKDVSEPCSRLIQKLMEKKRDDRVQTPQELVTRINVLLDPDNAATGKRSTVNGRANKSGARSAVGRAVTGPRSPISQTGPRAQISGGIESTGPLQRVSTGQRAAVSPDSTTGSAQPVSGDARDAAASAQRKAVRKQSLPFPVIIGITAVVIAIVYFVVSSGKTPPPTIAKEAPVSPIPVAVAPTPAPETRPAVKTPSRDDKARTEWLGIQEFAKTHADDYPALLDRLKSGAELARDTAVAPQIADEQKSVEARWAESFGKVLKTQIDLANAAAAKSDFAGAMNALNADAVPENLRVLQWREQLDAGRNGIREKADTAVKAVLDAARALAAGNDETGLKNALEKLKSADAIPADLAASAKSIAEERTRWTAQLGIVQLQAEAAKKDRLDKAQAAVAAVRKELAPVLTQSHFSAALELLENKLHDPALANGKELLNAEKKDLEGVIALRQRALDAIHASVGKTLTLNRGKTTITGKVGNDASGKSVTLQLAEGPEMAIGVDQLEARDINALAPAIGDGAGKAEDLRRRGVMFLDVGDLNKAKDYFKSARDAGLGDAVKRYLDAIENLELGEVEVRARHDWADADVLFQSKRWTDAQRSYTLFKEADGKTKFFAEVASELKVRLETIDVALNPLRPGLVATYYHNNDFKESERILQRIDANVNFDWNNTPPAKEVPHDQYSVRWVGSIKIPKAGHYTFATEADDGARLWIDGKVLINDWTTHGVTRFAGEIDLTEGLHEIRVEFFQAGGGSSIQMKWTLRGSPEAIVPAEALVHDPKLEAKK